MLISIENWDVVISVNSPRPGDAICFRSTVMVTMLRCQCLLPWQQNDYSTAVVVQLLRQIDNDIGTILSNFPVGSTLQCSAGRSLVFLTQRG